MADRAAHDAEQVGRILIEKRCEVYTQVASLLMELEEALDQDDGLRARYLLQDVRRCLRGALAFLTDEVVRELEGIEALGQSLPAREDEPLSATLADELADRLQLLHVKLSRALTLPRLQALEEIVGLPARLRRRLAADGREQDLRARQRELEQQCWQLEADAREQLGKRNYAKAVRALRRAIAIDPERAVLHNDLGVVLSLLGRTEEAVESYRAAVTMNERHPERRTDEWTTSTYNLGVALRKSASEASAAGRSDEALERLRQARAAFQEYTRLSLTGPKVEEAARWVAQLGLQITNLEAAAGELA